MKLRHRKSPLATSPRPVITEDHTNKVHNSNNNMAVGSLHNNTVADSSSIQEENKRLKQEVASLRKRLNARQEQDIKTSRATRQRNTRRSPPPPLPSLGEQQVGADIVRLPSDLADGLHHRYELKKGLKSKDSNMIIPDDPDLESPISPRSQTEEHVSLLQAEDDCSDDEAMGEPEGVSFANMVMDRAGWLVGLLVLQSMSSFIIQRNEGLLQKHLVIIRFLTMLVGAGGNAGNQASVRVIRGLAVGSIKGNGVRSFLWDEFHVGLCLSVILGVAGWLRAAVFATPLFETVAITASLFMIVMISVLLGATLPLGMKHVGIDPAHSSTTIQVLMDILGVTITVYVSAVILDSPLGAWLGVEPSET